MASNATKVLRALGIDLASGDCGRALEHFELRTARGKLIRALPVAAITAELGDPFVSIHRNELMRTLQDAAGDTPIHYGAEVVDVEIGDAGSRATCADGTECAADVLIGADGIRRPSGRRSQVSSRRASTATYAGLPPCAFAIHAMVPRICRPLLGQGTAVRAHRHRRREAYWWGTKNMPAAQARDWRG